MNRAFALFLCVAGCFYAEPARPPAPPPLAVVSAAPTVAPAQDVVAAPAEDGTIRLAQLPKEGRDTVVLIDSGGPYPYPRDGITFQNRERRLPAAKRYREYTVPTPGERTRGARRLVQADDGTLYYSDDHYRSFRLVVR